MSSHKIKIDGELLEKAKQCAEALGYATVDEFVVHTVDKEIKRMSTPDQGSPEAKAKIAKQLQGLGYLE